MNPSRFIMKCMWTTNPSGGQRGFAIPAAIFIVVILAALGAFLVTIGGGQQLGHAQDVAGIRALQAAKSGVDWGVFQVLNTSGAFRSACNGGAASQILPALTNMEGLAVLVECAANTYSDGAATQHSYRITATACNNAVCPYTAADLPNLYVERRVSSLVAN